MENSVLFVSLRLSDDGVRGGGATESISNIQSGLINMCDIIIWISFVNCLF